MSDEELATLSGRIKAAASALRLEPDQVQTALKDLGVEDEATGLPMLDDEEIIKFGDFRSAIDGLEAPEDGKLTAPKIGQLRMAFKFLRGGDQRGKGVDSRTVSLQSKFGVQMSMQNVSFGELLAEYNPDKKDAVFDEIKRRYPSQAIIAYIPGTRDVDVDATVAYVTDTENGVLTPSDTIMGSGGIMIRLWPPGELPDLILDEDPMFLGKALGRSGRSTVNHLNWSEV